MGFGGYFLLLCYLGAEAVFSDVSFQQLWSRWLIPGLQAELSATTFPATRLNRRKHVSVEAV